MSFKIEVAEVEPEWKKLDPKQYPGMEVLMKFQTPDFLTKLTRKCTETVRGSRGEDARQQLDYVRFGRTLAEKAVLGWRGFKLEYLESMLPITEGTRQAVKDNGDEVPFSIEAAQALAVHASDSAFLRPLSRVVTDWAGWKESEEADGKNESAA